MTNAEVSPKPSRANIAIRVTPEGIRHIRSGHPWLYENSVVSASTMGEAGDIGVVFDAKGRFAALGLWDPDSLISLQVLATTKATVNADFWRSRITAALSLRQTLIDGKSTSAFRIINGENDGFGGLVVDRYADFAVVKVYSRCWLPHLDLIVEILVELTQIKGVMLRLARRVESYTNPSGSVLTDGDMLYGTPPPDEVEFVENGLRFSANLAKGHKTGHFLDQRDNRAKVRELANGLSVLDVFSCTGGFSIYAAAGGAKSVTSVDISPNAIGAIDRNFELNAALTSSCKHDAIVGDAIEVMTRLVRERKTYDMVIVDPPSFAQKQSSIPLAEKAYVRLNVLAMDLCKSGGILVSASCSSRIVSEHFYSLVYDASDITQVRLAEMGRTTHGIDHPISFAQGAYLKALFARVMR